MAFCGHARSTEKTLQPLSIIIPMGGSGADFAEAGFRMPKPLVFWPAFEQAVF